MKTKSKAAGKTTKEKPQGKIKGSGVNKPAVPAKVPQVDMKNRYGKPTQTQKL